MKALSYLNKFLYKYRGRLLLGILFIILTNIFNVLMPYLVRVGFDSAFEQILVYRNFGKGVAASEFRGQILNTAMVFGLLLLLTAIMKGIFLFFMRQTIIVMSRKIEYDLKNDLYNHYQELPLSFYRKHFTGDLMNRLSEDVSRVRMYLGPAIMYFINLVFTFISVIYMMLTVNAELSFWVLLPLPVLSISIYFVSELINKKSDRIQEKLSGITSFVQETFSGIRVVKAFVSEPYFLRHFDTEAEAYRRESMGLTKVNALFSPLVMLLIGLSTLIAIYLGGKGVIEGRFTFGNIAEFVIYINLLIWPVASLGWVSSIVQRAAASQARINEFMQTKPDIVSGSEEPFIFEKDIVFDHVTFQYEGKNLPALSDFTIRLKKGHTLGIVGATGSGKTTVANLLLRSYDVNEGVLKIDGKNIRDVNLRSYRQGIGYVPQDVFLFSESIADNIAFGMPSDTDRKAIEEAARQAEVYQNIIEFPLGFDTVVGERGITLSGGQKQRIAIARALIKQPDILILDDCLSAVDHHTETNIINNLQTAMQGKTAVIISHRISSIIQADYIIVLDHGRIAEQGTHRELLDLKGLYATLHARQSAVADY